ncbi:Pseudouridine synthase II [Macrophomina phaseolina MS6]|uniref:tRNA pseudouridine(55) synthase n=2 Tax=Macrophomina phaseolina TaxID=35725 RepID=K2RSD0_MACPH|nr:Pseudouridine synthase II [Macrophomina phaseolina MS6]KAH7038933.1 pseudouridine synthase [Macrophomina phaseolina]
MFGFSPTLRRAAMSSSKPQLIQGVFAIHKPPGISSAQVLRDVERQFNPSKLFAPLLDAERQAVLAEKNSKKDKYRRKKGPNRTTRVKLGHGGTLDPLATGVLIAGVGGGTKALGRFLGECTKTYEATVLFGCATDTYDNTGKIMGRAPYAHVTRPMVEEALDRFKGDVMQKPPVYSALKFNGKKAYEIMREGGKPPEMQERPVTVYKLELVDWMEPGSHAWRFPKEELEAPKEDKDAALSASTSKESPAETGEKRKREDEAPASPSLKKTKMETEGEIKTVTPNQDGRSEQTISEESTVSKAQDDGSNAPAALIRMTVSSGFYVRTLCHDLGAAVNSLGCMTYLVRTQQGEFELGKNVLEYEELEKGEDVWGPKIKGYLESWMAREKERQAEHGKLLMETRSRSRSPAMPLEKTQKEPEGLELD